jgi:large subunit ribosomal protein L13
MPYQPTKTTLTNPSQDGKEWYLIDAEGKTLGRLCSEVAKILMGKHKPTYVTNCGGDGVIVVNAEKIKVTGNKDAQKVYRHHTGAMSGMREIPYRTMLARKPTEIIYRGVKGMVPHTRLGDAQMGSLRVFAGPEHDLHAQKPIAVNC